MPLRGLWLGLVAGYAVTTVLSGAAVLRSDWPRLSQLAVARSQGRASAAAPPTVEPLSAGAQPEGDAAHDAEALEPAGGGGGADGPSQAGGGGAMAEPLLAGARESGAALWRR